MLVRIAEDLGDSKTIQSTNAPIARVVGGRRAFTATEVVGSSELFIIEFR